MLRDYVTGQSETQKCHMSHLIGSSINFQAIFAGVRSVMRSGRSLLIKVIWKTGKKKIQRSVEESLPFQKLGTLIHVCIVEICISRLENMKQGSKSISATPGTGWWSSSEDLTWIISNADARQGNIVLRSCRSVEMNGSWIFLWKNISNYVIQTLRTGSSVRSILESTLLQRSVWCVVTALSLEDISWNFQRNKTVWRTASTGSRKHSSMGIARCRGYGQKWTGSIMKSLSKLQSLSWISPLFITQTSSSLNI